MKPVCDYEVIVHGVEHEQFFQGCGVSFTAFTDVATGIGCDANEAYEDALESLGQAGWDVDGIKRHVSCTECELPEDAHEDLHVFVSVRVR